jgi:hypothetical protein
MTPTSIIALQEGCCDIAKGLRKNEDFGRMDESKKAMVLLKRPSPFLIHPSYPGTAFSAIILQYHGNLTATR